MKGYLKILYLILLWIPHFKSTAQDSMANSVNQQVWLDFNPSYKLKKGFTLYGGFGVRASFPYSWSRYLITPSVKHNLPRMLLKKYPFKEELYGGLGIFFTDNKYATNILELRPFQGYSLTAPNRIRLQIKHYVRLEERFELQTDDWINTFGLRLRYTGSVTIRFQGDLWSYGKGFYIPFSADFFWNLIGTRQFNDKIRLVGGIGHDFASKWRAAFLFGYNLSKVDVGESFQTNDILYRVRVYYLIPPKKGEKTPSK